MKAYLVLENGKVFEGEYFGARGEVTGEIVFTTGMTGYIETLTDPSYYGQIVLQTFPLIGNYGIISEDFENVNVGVKAYIAKYPCKTPSNFRCEDNIETFLKERGVIGLRGIDTRALTKIIRENGVMNGKIKAEPPVDSDYEEIAKYSVKNPIAAVSAAAAVSLSTVDKSKSDISPAVRRIALMDFGAKQGITNAFLDRNCKVWAFPYNVSAEEIMKIKPHGIMLSNGPGDPADSGNKVIIETLRTLMRTDVPIFGICMGHQLLAIAHGYETRKLKFGHRGANQPVKDTKTGKVYITSQNHGYEVIADSTQIKQFTETGFCSFINVNDGSCEGMDYGNSFSVQFHPEACGGPLDTSFLFDKFLERINVYAERRH